MPDQRRRERLASLIEQVVSELLQRHVRDPRIGFTSITAVEVTADARYAKIHVSVMGSEEERRDTMRGLERAAGFIRSKLGEELTIRHVPEISFHLDRSLEQGDRVLALINQLSAAGTTPAASEGPAGKAPRRRTVKVKQGDQ